MLKQTYEQPKAGVAITQETGGKDAPAGLYRHPKSGQEQITTSDPLWGNAQSQAFKRLGFVFVRKAKPGEIKTLPELSLEAAKADASNIKGLSARLDKLEGVADENKALSAENKELREQLAKQNTKSNGKNKGK